MTNRSPWRRSSSSRAGPRNDSIPRDTYEQFLRLFVAQAGRLRAFLHTLVPSLDERDEVLQETSLVARRKFAQVHGSPPVIRTGLASRAVCSDSSGRAGARSRSRSVSAITDNSSTCRDSVLELASPLRG